MKRVRRPLGREYGAAIAKVKAAAARGGYKLTRTPTRFGQLYTLHDGATLRSVVEHVYLGDIQRFLRARDIDA
ncbi:hypothetical protein O4J56_05985 [Nocardiopsis sp. RSe5-2]|uniref:Uncharacterized protein n=1 Tax=Nocardiopsis endophytica TaxID=3018445 RepID=A0ABT4TZQ2_9ACTN|nr:hypothetical protein [Nocardiopsis endophytica]MDA2810182.1 hypothetical protein [Nocardiopsis endophytica]